MLKITKVGNLLTEYPDWHEQEFLTLNEYMEGAKRIIKSSLVFGTYAHILVNDEDAISHIAQAMMTADWKFKEDGGLTRYNYRYTYALFAIKQCIANLAKSKKNHLLSLDRDEIYDAMLMDVRDEPSKILMEKEENEKAIKVQDILNNNILSERQKEYLKLYYVDELPFHEIGNRFGISKQRVQSVIKECISRLKENLVRV